MRIGPNSNFVHRLLCIFTLVFILLLACGQVWSRVHPLKSNHDGRPNPWRGLSGCMSITRPGKKPLYLAENLSSDFSCKAFLGLDAQSFDPAKIHLDSILRIHMQPWLASPITARPGFLNSRKTNLVDFPGRGPITAGGDVRLTLDALSQTNAQMLVNCMTGNPGDCQKAGIDSTRWNHMRDNTAARSMAIVQLDIKSGEIEVLAWAGSKEFLEDYKNSRKKKPSAPTDAKEQHKDQPDNLALFQEAHPGSINKPWMALALMRSGKSWFDIKSEKERTWLDHVLRTSDTPALINRILCKDSDFSGSCAPRENLDQTARDLGWNGGKRDVLLGGEKGLLPIFSGRIYMQLSKGTSGKWEMIPTLPLNNEKLSQCSKNKWSRCRGENEARISSELLGAGSSRVNPLSVASAYAKLGAAANGNKKIPPPHLAKEVRQGMEILRPAADHPIHIDSLHARAILSALSQTHKAGKEKEKFWAGTAFTACQAVHDAKTCNRMDNISMKTGTPGFSHEHFTWQERRTRCKENQDKISRLQEEGKPIPQALRSVKTRCKAIPYKWAVLLVRSENKAERPYEKVIVILSERNWRKDGYIDSKGERGTPNISAEAAFRYLKMQESKDESQFDFGKNG